MKYYHIHNTCCQIKNGDYLLTFMLYVHNLYDISMRVDSDQKAAQLKSTKEKNVQFWSLFYAFTIGDWSVQACKTSIKS